MKVTITDNEIRIEGQDATPHPLLSERDNKTMFHCAALTWAMAQIARQACAVQAGFLAGNVIDKARGHS